MIFSELSLAKEDFGLDYNPDAAALYGSKCGYGVCIYDSPAKGVYAVSIAVELLSDMFDDASEAVAAACTGLPKNTILSRSITASEISISLNRDDLLQEKITTLIEFLDKLTAELKRYGIKGKPHTLKIPSAVPKNAPKNKKGTIKLGFDLNSVKGMLGAVIAAVVCVIISVMTVDIYGGLFIGEIVSIVIGGASAALIIFDYKFLARKIDVCGLIINTVLTVCTILFSAYLIGIKSYLHIMPEKNISEIIEKYSHYTSVMSVSNPEITAFQFELISKGLFAAAAATVIAYLLYFRKNSKEMYSHTKKINSEKKD